MSQKKFPFLIHVAYERDANDDDDYPCIYTDGGASIEPGMRVAIYKRVDDGTVRGPKSFISSRKA